MLDQQQFSNKIIRIEPTVQQFSITWMLGAFCNYDCMYCPRELHDATVSNLHDLNTLQHAWHKIYDTTVVKNLPYKIAFTGGEVTANKNFLPFLKWLRSNFKSIEHIAVTTNGSASADYYLDLGNVVESISFSTHSEFMDEQRFFDNVLKTNRAMLRPKKSVHVNIMDEHWNQERIAMYKDLLENHSVSYSINEIDYTKQTRNHPYIQGKYNIESFSGS